MAGILQSFGFQDKSKSKTLRGGIPKCFSSKEVQKVSKSSKNVLTGVIMLIKTQRKQ